nr:hypothetical protein [Tanacetum cinerariifolium]
MNLDVDCVNDTDVNNEDVIDANLDDDDDSVLVEETNVVNDYVEDVDVDFSVNIFDPRNLDTFSSDMIKVLVAEGPKEINLLRRVLKINVLNDAAYYTIIVPNNESVA